MIPTQRRLFDLTAADLMRQPVVTVPREMSMQGAARRLIEEGVSGAPVVDAEGCCVGVVSTSDFLRLTEREKYMNRCRTHDGYFSAWEIIEPGDLPAESVSQFMTADPVVVAPTTPIRDLARMMIDTHIHRLLIVGEGSRPVGIVTCTDLLAAIAGAR
jgi:CBS domain-containing protein